MSHLPERKEKNCLNCEVPVQGRYCHVCGQENTATRQGVVSLVKHFIFDIFHFDGKFFDTLKYLLFKPGFVPKEYMEGKRINYLDPIRMYLFTSALFFLIFFSINTPEDAINITGDKRLMTKVERFEYSSHLYKENAQHPDSVVQKQLKFLLDTSFRIGLSKEMNTASDTSFIIKLKNVPYLMVVSKIQKGQDELNVGNDWFSTTIEKKWKAYRQKFADDDKAMLLDMANTFLHKFPYILFVSLPLFAFILKLLYTRRKHFYYNDHAVFTLYHYIFSLILLIFYFLLSEMHDWMKWGLLRFLAGIILLSGGIYLAFAIKRFYKQGWAKTLCKFLLLNVLGLFVLILIFILFLIVSLFQL